MAEKKDTKKEEVSKTTEKVEKKEVKEVKKETKTKTEAKKTTKKVAEKKPAAKKVETKKTEKKVETKKAEKKTEKKDNKKTEKKADNKEEKVIEAKASLKYERIAPSKVNIVAKLIRGKDTDEALTILKFTNKAASPILTKLIESAMANAENNHSMNKDNLYVSEIQVNVGPILKRMRPRARGSGFRINKRTSHIDVVLRERV